MRINIHNTTPSSAVPKWFIWMFIALFLLVYSLFAMMSFCLIYYARSILSGIIIALIPFAFLAYFLLLYRALAYSFAEITDELVVLTEFYFGRKTVREIPISHIHHTKQLFPSSFKLCGLRIPNSNVPYIVFYDRQERQLFKLRAYPEALKFQQYIAERICSKSAGC